MTSIQPCCQDQRQTGNKTGQCFPARLLRQHHLVRADVARRFHQQARHLMVTRDATALQRPHLPRGKQYLHHTPPHTNLKHLVDYA